MTILWWNNYVEFSIRRTRRICKTNGTQINCSKCIVGTTVRDLNRVNLTCSIYNYGRFATRSITCNGDVVICRRSTITNTPIGDGYDLQLTTSRCIISYSRNIIVIQPIRWERNETSRIKLDQIIWFDCKEIFPNIPITRCACRSWF